MSAQVEEIWVYPVKACQGVRVKKVAITPTGLENDRAWCIVDEDGVNISPLEACSGRKLPALSTIDVSFSSDGSELFLNAKGMQQLAIPVSITAYEGMDDIRVECSGKSTTAASGGGWSLGFIPAKRHKEGSDWVTKYLNGPNASGKLNSGKSKTSKYALCRSMTQGLKMTDYPPIFPVIEKALVEKRPDYYERFAGNARRFTDFAPLLLLNKESAVDLGKRCAAEGVIKNKDGGPDKALQRHGGNYPLRSFRGNVVVGGKDIAPWVEETWAEIVIGGSVTFKKVKECPRCTVPCREQEQGEHLGQFLFAGDSLRMWRVLKSAFPRKYDDAEWGSWAGAFFGVYMGNNGQEGEISEGDKIEIIRKQPWDKHLRFQLQQWHYAAMAAALAVGVVALWQVRKN